jgi:hypothetical protein
VVEEDENRDDKDSNFPEDVWESTPVNPEECEIKLSAEEIRFFIHKDYGGRTSSWATKEELKALRQALKESGGFDVPFVPWCHYHGTRRTNISTVEAATPVVQCAKCALDFYNKKNGSNFVFDRLVMSLTRPCAGIEYCITFKAKSRSPEFTKTFQTKAFIQLEGDLHIVMCRIKNENDQPEQKAEQCKLVISTS